MQVAAAPKHTIHAAAAQLTPAGAGFAAGGLVDLEIMKLMTEDDIGKGPDRMIAALR
jgi:hypothetical protein